MKIFGIYIIFGLMWLVSLLPMRVLYIISDGLYYMLYYGIKYRRKVVENNLKKAFPEKNDFEIKKISKGFYRHLCDTMVESLAYITISPRSINKRVVYKNIEVIENFYRQGRTVIGVMGHYGNWEWGGNFPMHTSYKALTTFKPLDDKKMDKLFKRVRERFGFTPVSMRETARQMINYIHQKEKVILILIADQTPAHPDINYCTEFLNQSTPVFLGPEKLSKAFDAPLVFIKMMKVKRGYYEVTFTALCERPKETVEHELTDLHVNFLEKIIREKPEYWLWSHRRWKYAKPK